MKSEIEILNSKCEFISTLSGRHVAVTSKVYRKRCTYVILMDNDIMYFGDYHSIIDYLCGALDILFKIKHIL